MTDTLDYHTNAAMLIVAAAKKSGLLESVAEALCAFSNSVLHNRGCGACQLLQHLAGALDEVSPTDVLERMYGEGAGLPTYSKEELAPYMVIPADKAAAPAL